VQEAAVLKGADPHHGQASRLAVAAIMLAVVFVAMALIGPLLSGELRDRSHLPPIVLLFEAR
jgi:hypothetical protein